MRPYRLASTAQPPPTAASVATAAKVSAMPASIGNPLRTKRPVGAREHERQHRQDARAEDRQNAAQISEQKQNHGWITPLGRRGLESQRDAIHAIAQAGGLRAVIEDVAEMTAAAPAMNGGARPCRRMCLFPFRSALSKGAQKLGQPVPLSNLVVEEKDRDRIPRRRNCLAGAR